MTLMTGVTATQRTNPGFLYQGLVTDRVQK
jgi:hypothetical protein